MNVNTILFFAGFAVSIIALLLMLIKVMKGKKVGVIALVILTIGIVVLGLGVWKEIQQRNNPNNSVAAGMTNNTGKTAKTSDNKLTNSKEADTNKTSENKNAVFDANGSVVPQVTESKDGYKVITDADGSKAVFAEGIASSLNISSDGTRFYKPANGTAVVQIPQNEANSQGKVYKRYGFERDSLQVYMSQTKDVVFDEFEEKSNNIPSNEDKNEEYNTDTYKDMSPVDFVYRVMPDVKVPKNTIENDFLSGTYVGKKQSVLSSDTIMSIKIVDDKFLELQCSYIYNMNANYGYKLECLGKNAYKLYLYPAQFDRSGKEVTISDKPVKRTFIIYMKSKDSFDIVFINDSINRVSVSMNKS